MNVQEMMRRVESVLAEVPENEVVQGVSASEALARLRTSIQVRERVLQEQSLGVVHEWEPYNPNQVR